MSKDAALAMITSNPTTAPAAAPAAPTEAPKAEPPKDLESTRLANFAKREAEIFKRTEMIKARELELDARKNKYDEVEKRVKEFEETKSKDVIAAMKLAGFTDTDILNALASNELTPEEKAAKAAQAVVDKHNKELEAKAKEEADKAAQAEVAQNKAAIDAFKQKITNFVASDKEAYEYLNYHGAVAEELVFELVKEVFNQDGEIIPLKEAADEIEKFYEEQDLAMSVLKKRNRKPVGELAKTAAAPVEEPAPKAPTKTLSNRAVATTPSATRVAETYAQKKERLIESIKLNGLRK